MHKLNYYLEKKIDEKTNELAKSYYHDPNTGISNINCIRKHIANNDIDKIAILYMPNTIDYQNLYGYNLMVKANKLFGDYAKSFFSVINGNIYQGNLYSFAIGCNSNIPIDKFIDLLYEFKEDLKTHAFYANDYPIYFNTIIAVAHGSDNIFENAYTSINVAISHGKELIYYNYESDLVDSHKYNLEIVSQLHDAIENDRIVPYFQPIYDNALGKVTKYEALVRIINDKGEILSPTSFLDVSKRSGLYHEITKKMIQKTFKKFENTNYEFSINIALTDILNEDIKQFIFNELKNSSVSKNVIFEVVESEGIENFDEVIEFISQVKKLGGKIAIDDFGSGYSNLVYLAKLKSDYIKLDGSIVKQALDDIACETIIKAILNFAKVTQQKVVAEFVSNEELYKKMKELGVDYSQGYYIGTPSCDIN